MSADYWPRQKMRPRKRRPIWIPVVIVIGAIILLFAVGFGLSRLLQGGSPAADAPIASSVAPLPCATTMITPAEVLPRTAKVKVNVYNATDHVGLANTVATILTERGFVLRKVANDPRHSTVLGTAEIRYGAKGRKGAELLHYYFPDAVMTQDTRPKKVVDVVLGAKFVDVVHAAQVAAALASPSPSLSGPGCVSPTPTTAVPSVSAPAAVPDMPSATPSATPAAS